MTKDEVKDFIKALKTGEVHFKYLKKDGSLRKAHGTMKPHLIPNIKAKKATDKDMDNMQRRAIKRRHLPEDIIFYYDLDKKSFMSFKSTRFEGYVD